MEDEEYRDLLESKRFEIVQNLQVDRQYVFDYLRHKGVLDGEDCELIQCEKTTPLKIGKFVDVLARKGPQAYQCLLESLQLEHPALYKKLTGEEADACKYIYCISNQTVSTIRVVATSSSLIFTLTT